VKEVDLAAVDMQVAGNFTAADIQVAGSRAVGSLVEDSLVAAEGSYLELVIVGVAGNHRAVDTNLNLGCNCNRNWVDSFFF